MLYLALNLTRFRAPIRTKYNITNMKLFAIFITPERNKISIPELQSEVIDLT